VHVTLEVSQGRCTKSSLPSLPTGAWSFPALHAAVVASAHDHDEPPGFSPSSLAPDSQERPAALRAGPGSWGPGVAFGVWSATRTVGRRGSARGRASAQLAMASLERLADCLRTGYKAQKAYR